MLWCLRGNPGSSPQHVGQWKNISAALSVFGRKETVLRHANADIYIYEMLGTRQQNRIRMSNVQNPPASLANL